MVSELLIDTAPPPDATAVIVPVWLVIGLPEKSVTVRVTGWNSVPAAAVVSSDVTLSWLGAAGDSVTAPDSVLIDPDVKVIW